MLGCHDNFGKIFYLPIFFRKTFEFPFHNPCYWLLLEYIWRYIRIKFLNLNTVKWLFISIGSTLVLVALTYFFVQRKAIPFRFVKTYLFIVNHLFYKLLLIIGNLSCLGFIPENKQVRKILNVVGSIKQ